MSEENQEKLKFCPFCNEINSVILEKAYDTVSNKYIGFDIGCWNIYCGFQPSGWFETKELAIKNWNNRVK